MGFRLVPKSVTLNDLERCNGRVVCVISPNSAYYSKVVEDTPYFLQQKCSARNVVSGDISLIAIFAGNHVPLARVYSPAASENLTNNQP